MIPGTRSPHVVQQQLALEIHRGEKLPGLEPSDALLRDARGGLRLLPQFLQRRVALLHYFRQLGLVLLLLREGFRHEGPGKEAVDLVRVLVAVQEQLLPQRVCDGADSRLGRRVRDVARETDKGGGRGREDYMSCRVTLRAGQPEFQAALRDEDGGVVVQFQAGLDVVGFYFGEEAALVR